MAVVIEIPHRASTMRTRKRVLRTLALLGVLCALSPAARPAWAQDSVGDVLLRSGVRPVMPPTEAAAFTLPDLEGRDVSLADYQGQWVLLTFWATWCGPCISELPSLQQFWTRNRDGGFAVLAVAVGSDEAGVRDLVARKGLTFPVLLDRGDRVASTYQAWSVPLTYLVDPDGNLVGVVRGARDWAGTEALVRDLSTLERGAGAYAAREEPVALPPDLVPPTAEVSLGAEPAVAGTPFELLVRVSWADTGEDYRVHPPRLTLADGLRQDAVSTSSSSQDGVKVLTYSVTLLADEPGAYAVDPVEIRFTPPDGSEPLATRVRGPTAQVGEVPSAQVGLIVAAIALVGMAIGVVMLIRRARGRR